VKCVVWDLDNTLWDGVLLEDPQVRPRPALAAAIRELDAEGVLHSIASRNDPERALAALHAMQLDELFLCPQIGWQPKSQAVRRVSEELGVAADSIAFVDDDPFERAEVETALPEIRCFEPYQLADPAVRGALRPAVVTSDARQRRSLYRAELEPRSAEDDRKSVV
jgi:FkbH-like protein